MTDIGTDFETLHDALDDFIEEEAHAALDRIKAAMDEKNSRLERYRRHQYAADRTAELKSSPRGEEMSDKDKYVNMLGHAEDAHNEGNVSGRRTEEQSESGWIGPSGNRTAAGSDATTDATARITELEAVLREIQSAAAGTRVPLDLNAASNVLYHIETIARRALETTEESKA